MLGRVQGPLVVVLEQHCYVVQLRQSAKEIFVMRHFAASVMNPTDAHCQLPQCPPAKRDFSWLYEPVDPVFQVPRPPDVFV